MTDTNTIIYYWWWQRDWASAVLNLWFIHCNQFTYNSPTNLFEDFFPVRSLGQGKYISDTQEDPFPCVNIWKEELLNNTHFFSMLSLKLYLSTILPKINCHTVKGVLPSFNNILFFIRVPMTPLNSFYFLVYSWSSSLSDFFLFPSWHLKCQPCMIRDLCVRTHLLMYSLVHFVFYL